MPKVIESYLKNNFVSPGEKLGVIEEFMPGSGTYIENGNIYSQITGTLFLDKDRRELLIQPKTRNPLIPKVDDVIIGEVVSVQDKTLTLKIIQINITSLPDSFTGIMHISDVGTTYVKTMNDAFKVGDLVRARVISTKNREFHVSTQNEKLGVVQANCIYCGGPLINQRNGLRCARCNRTDKRKIAIDYGIGYP